MRLPSAFADGKAFWLAEAGRWPKASEVEFIRHASRALRRPFAPIEIGLLSAVRLPSAFADGKAFWPAKAGHWPKASKVEFIRPSRRPIVPIEIGLLRRCAPYIGLRRRESHLLAGGGRPLAEGL